MTNVYLLDYNLRAIAEVDCRAQCAWVLNTPNGELGTASIVLSVNESKLSEQLLRWGNILYIGNTPAGDWAGVVTGESDTQSEITLNATSAEILLDDRCMRRGLDRSGTFSGSFGMMLTQVITDANRISNTGLSAGDIQIEGPSLNDKRSGDYLTFIRRRQEITGWEWAVVPTLNDGGVPVLALSARPQLGTDHSANAALEEGVNLQFADGPIRTVTGRVKNDILNVGVIGTPDGQQILTPETDDTSISLYGPRQAEVKTTDVSKEALIARADADLARQKQPERRYTLVANSAAIYPYLRIGNYLALRLYSAGFDWQTLQRGTNTVVRIIGMSYDTSLGVVPLIVQEVI
jgi:hypothetical protein